MTLQLYHNPRCSKSRAALALLEARGVAVVTFDYLNNPLSEPELRGLAGKTGIPLRNIVRTGEDIYSELGLGNPGVSDDELIAAIIAYPVLLERPIFVNGTRAIVGRPPEAVLDIL